MVKQSFEGCHRSRPSVTVTALRGSRPGGFPGEPNGRESRHCNICKTYRTHCTRPFQRRLGASIILKENLKKYLNIPTDVPEHPSRNESGMGSWSPKGLLFSRLSLTGALVCSSVPKNLIEHINKINFNFFYKNNKIRNKNKRINKLIFLFFDSSFSKLPK